MYTIRTTRVAMIIDYGMCHFQYAGMNYGIYGIAEDVYPSMMVAGSDMYKLITYSYYYSLYYKNKTLSSFIKNLLGFFDGTDPYDILRNAVDEVQYITNLITDTYLNLPYTSEAASLTPLEYVDSIISSYPSECSNIVYTQPLANITDTYMTLTIGEYSLSLNSILDKYVISQLQALPFVSTCSFNNDNSIQVNTYLTLLYKAFLYKKAFDVSKDSKDLEEYNSRMTDLAKQGGTIARKDMVVYKEYVTLDITAEQDFAEQYFLNPDRDNSVGIDICQYIADNNDVVSSMSKKLATYNQGLTYYTILCYMYAKIDPKYISTYSMIRTQLQSAYSGSYHNMMVISYTLKDMSGKIGNLLDFVQGGSIKKEYKGKIDTILERLGKGIWYSDRLRYVQSNLSSYIAV